MELIKKFPIEVGKKVFLEPIGNAAKRGDVEAIEGRISKIGRQYFYVKSEKGFLWCREAKFDKESFRCYDMNLNYGYYIYETMQEFYTEIQRREQLKYIRHEFRKYNREWSSETVSKIYDILISDIF